MALQDRPTQACAAELLPGDGRWSEVVRVIDMPRDGAALKLNANALTQQVFCYLDKSGHVV